MAADKNYDKILEEVCEKLNNIDSIKDLDLLEIKNSVESIENLVTNTQASINFQEIKEKLENISLQVDSCNESILKDIFSDITQIKNKTANLDTYLGNIANVQQLSLTSAEFEEYQRQQLDLALKTNENIFNILKKIQETQVSSNSKEYLEKIEEKVADLHKNLSGYIEQVISKIETKTTDMDNISAVMKDISSIHQHSIKQTGNLVKMLEMNFNSFKNKEFADQVSKIKEIYDSLTIINAWIEKVGFLNKSIENVYARLGANIDFDDVSEKIDIIYENISALNDWAMKIDNIDEKILNVDTKITSLDSLSAEIQNIGNEIKNMQDNLGDINLTLPEGVDFEDLADKLDIIYENLAALNDWANKIDILTTKTEEFSDKFPPINDKLSEINDKFSEINDRFFEVNDRFSEVNDKFANVKVQFSELGDKLDELPDKFEETNNHLSENFNEISQKITQADNKLSDIPGIQQKLDEISYGLQLITRTTKNDTESYVYTLLDIESDFLKLHQCLDSNTEQSNQDIRSLKARFEELNDDISSISQRTNKLILTADDANKEFKTHLETFKETIAQFDMQRQILNPEEKFQAIGEKLADINTLVQNNIDANNSLSTAFAYLAEWVDATGSLLNSMNGEIAVIKQATSKDYTDSLQDIKSEIEKNSDNIDGLSDKLNELDELNNIKSLINTIIENINSLAEITNIIASSNDPSDIKSTLNGVLMQLNTSLTPNIDYINEKIDRLSEEHQNKFTELELLLKEKSDIQEKKIITLEEKVDNLYGKIDKLIETISEQNSHDEVKDILNYITTQIASTNETLTRRQATVDEISKISSDQTETNSAIKALISGQQIIVEKQLQLSAEQQTISEGQQAITEKQQQLSDNQKSLTEQQQQLSENQKTIAEGQQFIAERQQQLFATQKTITEGQKVISDRIAKFDTSVNKIVSYIEDDGSIETNEDKIIEEPESPVYIAEEISDKDIVGEIVDGEVVKPDSEG